MVSEMLSSIPDDIKMREMLAGPSPIFNLVERYNKIASESNAPLLDDTSNGFDLKAAIEALDEKHQMFLIDLYIKDVWSLCDPIVFESPAERDVRALHVWILKRVVTAIVVTLGVTYVLISFKRLILGDVVANAGLMDILSGLLEVAKEIIE